MKKIYEDNIQLCSNRTERKISPHTVGGSYYTDVDGFTVFDLDETKRSFANRNINICEGCFLVTEDHCYKIVSVSIREKKPKYVSCKTVLTDIRQIPFYNRQVFINRA